MMVRTLTYIFLVILVCGCGNKKGTQETVEQPEARPHWMTDRPIQSGYYIGVGSASKNEYPLDFAQVAKENALLDLASEIRVTISGESFLSTLEVNDYFQEEFISKISTSTKEYLEGYDLVDTWEDNQQYWTFYRLSVAEYNGIRAERKQSAMKRSADNLRRAKSFELEGDVRGAISNYLDGLVGIHEYWTESNEFDLNGQTIFLDHELHHGFKDLLRDIQIEPNPTEIVLNQMNRYREDVKVLVHLRGNPVRDFPLKYRVTFDGGYNRFLAIRTNDNGIATIRIENVSLEGGSTTRLEIESGMDKMDFEGIEMQVRKPLMDEIGFSSRQLPLRIILPSMSIESQELNLGTTLSSPLLSATLRSELASLGIRFVASSAQADYVVKVHADSRESGTSQGFHVAHLDARVEVLDRITGEVVYSWQENSIKGLQLNFESAGKEAYKKAAKKMEQIVGTEIIDAIL